jgi:hypothetical protein
VLVAAAEFLISNIKDCCALDILFRVLISDSGRYVVVLVLVGASLTSN